RVDVTIARDGDAVLRAFELSLKIAEIRVRLELRIALHDDQEPRQRTRELALRGLELLERLRIFDELRCRLYAADARSRLGHPEQHLLLLTGEAAHRLDQIGNQIGAALVLVQDLGPSRRDLL